MSEIREKAVRLLLQAAYEMAADNADSVADIFDCQHGFIDDLRRRAMLKLDKPYTAPDFDTAEQQIAETGLSLDMLDKRGVRRSHRSIPPRMTGMSALSAGASTTCWGGNDGSQDTH